MNKFEIRPQEIYLLERYSSTAYFKDMTDAFQNMLDIAEKALEEFMSDIPYDYRINGISAQPDLVWGENVLPNFRNASLILKKANNLLESGDLTALEYASNIEACFRGQRVDYPAEWMSQAYYDGFIAWQDKASLYSMNIYATGFAFWAMGDLTNGYDENSRGLLNLPNSLPIYRVNPSFMVMTGETVPQDGIYIPMIQEASAQLMLKGEEVVEALVGLDEGQFISREASQWALVERIADEGGSLAAMNVSALKGFACQKCPQSGNWWSPANESQSHYFKQGDIFPEIKNNTWGETIWYLEVINKE